MVAIFPNLCLWRRSLCSNLGGGGGIDPAKLHRASLKVANFKNQLFSQQNKIRATKVTNLLIAKSL